MALQKLLALALITLGFFFLLVYFGGKRLTSNDISTTDQTVSVPTQNIEAPADPSPAADNTPTSPQPGAPAAAPETPGQFNQLEQWLSDNSNSMSSFSPDDRRAMDDFVATLQAPEARRLGQIASDAKQSGNKRVLSIYLIGRTPIGNQAVIDFLNSEIPLKNNADAHSIDEAFNQKEKALRVMAIDQIVENSPSPQEAKLRLNQLLQSVRDPWLRGIISKRIQELP